MDVMALIEPLMPHMETLMSPLSMAKRGKEANDNTLFFLRALAHERLFFCLIPKNGFLALNMVFAIIQKQPFKWNMGDLSCLGDASCKDADGGPLNLTSIFDDESNGEPDKKWRRIVVHRDPVERFLSAYRSKCCLADTDGIQHCDQLFQLNRRRSEITPHAVASRLFSHGYRNGHWMPQRAFCGDLGTTWPRYTHHLHANALEKGLLGALQGRVDKRALHMAHTYLANGTRGHHIPTRHGGMGHRTSLTPSAAASSQSGCRSDFKVSDETRALLHNFYSVDYEMFERFHERLRPSKLL